MSGVEPTAYLQDRAARPCWILARHARPRTRHRDVTVYRCGDREQPHLGGQWCHERNLPCTRDGLGALRPACDEPSQLTTCSASTMLSPSPHGKIR